MLWLSTRRAIRGEEIAANAMKELAATSKETAERQLRAYVFVENAWVRPAEEPGAWRVEYRIKNFGQTPASQVSVKDMGVVAAAKPDIPAEETPIGAMAPGGDFIDNWTGDFGLPINPIDRMGITIGWLDE